MKRGGQKSKKEVRKVKFLQLGLVTLVSISLIIVLLINLRFTGYATFTSQPNSTNGKDTYLRENSTTNFGTDTVVKIGKTAAGLDLRGLLEFNVSSIPSANTVTSGILQLSLSFSNSANNVTIKVYRITNPWNQTAANWFNRTSSSLWTANGSDYSAIELDSVTVGTALTYYNFSITDAARGWVNGSYSNYGIVLIASSPAAGDFKEFFSSDDSTSATNPMIIIDHTPNAPPNITAISVNSTLQSLKKVGELAAFTVNWTDLDSSQTQLFVCNSSQINISGCGGSTLCSTSLASTNPSVCSYNITSSDNRTTAFWAGVCDGNNCSSAVNSTFAMNHVPTVLIIQPNGGETVNQSQGNYTIRFNTTDLDFDPLFGAIYYGSTQNSTTNTIASNLNLTNYCSSSSTTKNCTYSWNSTGAFGSFFLTIVVNDTYHSGNDSSDSNFTAVSILDSVPPNITAQWIVDSYIYSGKVIQIYANVSDESALSTVYVSINTTPQQNITMRNLTAITYNATFTAPQVGAYTFKVYARDIVGNLNDSTPNSSFNVTKPIASTLNLLIPQSSLPYSTIRISSQLNATDPLRDISGYLYVPDGFSFLQDYPQSSRKSNYTANFTNTTEWFLSTPITEGNYTLNITYSDIYSNSYNTSNAYLSVSYPGANSYTVALAAYPEVETTKTYYTEAAFRSSSGSLSSADTAQIIITDALGNLIVGPASLSNPSLGIYNYSYTIGSSVNEGQWKTEINITKNGISYFASQFWKVIGGPFDVRNITIENSAINALKISVITENKGGVTKDLTLTWNLTRTDTGALLDSGSDTFAVDANSEKTWTITPSTTYVGQVKITFLGSYSGTEKAGAFKTFSTTPAESGSGGTGGSGGGGGGGGGGAAGGPVITSKVYDLNFTKKESSLTLLRNTKTAFQIEVQNIGTKALTNLSLELEGVDPLFYTVSPKTIDSLKPKEKKSFTLEFLVPELTEEVKFNYVASSNELTKKEPGSLKVLTAAEFIKNEIEKLRKRIKDLKDNKNIAQFTADLAKCENLVNQASDKLEKEEFINAKDKLAESDSCLTELEKNINKVKEKGVGIMADYLTLTIVIVLIVIVIIMLLIGIYLYMLYKRMSLGQLLQRESTRSSREQEKTLKEDDFDKRLDDIDKKLKI